MGERSSLPDRARTDHDTDGIDLSFGIDVGDEIVFFQAGGMVFGLWTALGGHGAPGIELAHNVRTPEEVDAVLAAAVRAGATITRPAARADWGGYTGAFADPDGYARRLRTTLTGRWPRMARSASPKAADELGIDVRITLA